jgi:hypothetical protein
MFRYKRKGDTVDKSQKQKVLLALEEKYPGISKTTRNAALRGIAEWELAKRLESATPADLAECPEYFTLKDAATENEDAPIMETVQGAAELNEQAKAKGLEGDGRLRFIANELRITTREDYREIRRLIEEDNK